MAELNNDIIMSLKTGSDEHVKEAIDSGLLKHKVSSSIKQVDEDNHEIDFVITTDTVDRDRERVLPKSFESNLKFYLDNPIVLWSHNNREPAVGRMMSHEITDDEFVAKTRFAVDESEFAATLWKLYSANPPFMKATSVGFIPLVTSSEQEDKLEGQQGLTYKENELLEYSLVSIPSNRGALAKMYSEIKQHIDPLFLKEIEKMIEDGDNYSCGHMRQYDADGKVYDECRRCYKMASVLSASLLLPTDTGNNPPTLEPKEIQDEVDEEVVTGAEGTTDKKASSITIGEKKADKDCNELAKTIAKRIGFTIAGSYERDMQDIRDALPDYKRDVLGFENFEFLIMVATFSDSVICWGDLSDLLYQIDWERGANRAIMFSNPRIIELEIGANGRIIESSVDIEGLSLTGGNTDETDSIDMESSLIIPDDDEESFHKMLGALDRLSSAAQVV